MKNRSLRIRWWFFFAATLCLPLPARGEIKAFPQAEGFGAAATGGRGGDVYHVTKLTDDGSVGTLRHGITTTPSSGRTIVFDVGGWINITSKLGVDTHIHNLTIAGQTAPGGIGVRGHQFSVGGDDIVVRHMRFKPGKDSGRNDSVGTNSNAQRVIYDHISAGFSYDENFSVQATDVTLQYSTVSYGLEDHSAGSLLENPHRLTMHHNLYAHNNTRNPKHRVHETLDWVDNVIYNWDERAFFMQGTDGPGFFWTANIDGNYFIAGPNQDNTKPLSGGSLDDYGTWWGTNAYDADGDGVHNGQDYTRTDSNFSDVSSALTTWSDTPYPVTDEVWKDASTQAAYERVLSQFGATPDSRDEVDQLLHDDVVSRTGSIISHENQLVARGVSNAGFGTLGGGQAPQDTDQDGMPDDWEVKHGTPVLTASNNNDFDYDGYTDLEEYLNDLAAFKAIGPIEFAGIGRFADSSRWTRRWEPSKLDDVEVNNGAAFVDAVGQKAGNLRLGTELGGNGRLYITSGWLEVTDDITVGGDGVGRVEQYGGEVRVLQGSVEIVSGAYHLRGGLLTTPLLAKESTGEFDFAGGVLSADEVNFDLLVAGGKLAAGVEAIGTTFIDGDLTIDAGILAVDVAGMSLADEFVVAGDAVLGGDLEVSLLDYLPTPGESWQILTANSFSGEFDFISDGFDVEQFGNSLWLVANSAAAGTSIPEPSSLTLIFMAALGLAVTGLRRRYVVLGAVVVFVAFPFAVDAATLPVTADAQLSENGTTGVGDATNAGSGSGASLNARWNYTSTPANRNEWTALKFDLAAYPDKQRIVDVSLRTYMFRSDANNTQTLHFYALTPGTAGENWNEATVTYGSMPGFTFDGNSNTNILDVGGAIQDLGSFAVSGVTTEGSLSQIDPTSLTSYVQSMGSNDLLTLLISYQVPNNGQWRIASREATATTTGVLTGSAGDFAPFLDFTVGPSGVRGDYNDDGKVSAADFTVWRDNLGSTALVNEEVSPHDADFADFLYWRERYGATDTGAPAFGSSAHAVPEPQGVLVLLWIVAPLVAFNRPVRLHLACYRLRRTATPSIDARNS